MSSGYGVDKPRKEEHPNRQVPKSRFTGQEPQFGGGRGDYGGVREPRRPRPSAGGGSAYAEKTTYEERSRNYGSLRPHDEMMARSMDRADAQRRSR